MRFIRSAATHLIGACLLVAGALAGCGDDRDAIDRRPYRVLSLADTLTIYPAAVHVAEIPGFRQPESVRYDPDQDVFFVSNMAGFGSVKDGVGYIVRVNAADYSQSVMFAESGKAGTTLHAPKGLAIRGDVLWTADIDVLRGFDRRTGAPVGVIDFAAHSPAMLNDVALGPDGDLYVSDTGIHMTPKGVIYVGGDRIFAVSPGGAIRVVAEGHALKRPNGLHWDPVRKRWLVASFDPFASPLYTLAAPRPGGAPTTRDTALVVGLGNFDGVEVLEDGRIIYTTWDDHTVRMIDGERHVRIAANILAPADLGVDSRRKRLLVPSALLGRVEVLQMLPLGAAERKRLAARR